jgi:NADH dehydrogenase
MSGQRMRILIPGGGFGGLYTALEPEQRLARDPDIAITLVNRENFISFTPRFHEAAASDLDLTHIVNPGKLLKRVDLFPGEVQRIDLKAKEVVVAHGSDQHTHALPYDHLVIGLSAITNFFRLPGHEERALTMKSLGDAISLSKLLRAEKKLRVVLDWSLDLLFSNDLVQFSTFRSPTISGTGASH